MKKLFPFLVTVLLFGCGGGGSSSSGAGLSNNISGVWSGTIAAGGTPLPVVVTVNQAVPGRSLASSSVLNAAQALTGTIAAEGTITVNGTKDGNVWNVSGNAGPSAIITVNQTLTSVNTSAGTLVVETGTTETFNLNLTKS